MISEESGAKTDKQGDQGSTWFGGRYEDCDDLLQCHRTRHKNKTRPTPPYHTCIARSMFSQSGTIRWQRLNGRILLPLVSADPVRGEATTDGSLGWPLRTPWRIHWQGRGGRGGQPHDLGCRLVCRHIRYSCLFPLETVPVLFMYKLAFLFFP